MSEWSWPQFACAVLGITSLIASGVLDGTQAESTLTSTGLMLVSLAVPWPRNGKKQ